MPFLHALLDRLTAWLARGAQWCRTAPHLLSWCTLAAVGVVFVMLSMGYHEHQMPWAPSSGLEIARGWRAPPTWITFYNFLSPYLKLMALMGGVLFQLALWRAGSNLQKLVRPLWIACGCYALWLGVADFPSEWERVFSVATGRPFSTTAYVGKIVLLVIACFSPAAALSWYQTLPLWARYVVRTFAQPLLFCMLAFWALRLLSDVIDNLRDFQANQVSPVKLIGFYANLAPSMLVQSAAPALLLAVLHTLVRLVRGNEMISLLCSGLSFARVLQPMLIAAAGVCMTTMALNYDWAPRSEDERAEVLRGMQARQREPLLATGLLHYHESTRRLWYVGIVPRDLRGGKMSSVLVRQFDEQGQLQKGWTSFSVWWDERTRTWTFSRGVMIEYADNEAVRTTEFNSPEHPRLTLDEKNWPETLWDIVSSAFDPNTMGVPDLTVLTQDALRLGGDARLQRQAETQLWRRLLHPWEGFVLLFFASVLTPIHARQGLLRHVGHAMIAFFVMLFLDNTMMNLARTGRAPAVLALMVPHLLFGIAGALILARRMGSLPWLDRWRQLWRTVRGRRTRTHPGLQGFYYLNPGLKD